MKLELKHIAGYLPYGLKYKVPQRDNVRYTNSLSIYQDAIFITCTGQQQFRVEEIKPILRPLSDLYSPLPDGSIPIVELAKTISDWWGVEFICKHTNEFSAITFSEDGHEFGFNGNEFYFIDDEADSIEIPQLTCFNFLFEYHFDIYNLIEQGLAIGINSIN